MSLFVLGAWWRRVGLYRAWDVTGPIEAKRILSIRLGFRARALVALFPSSATKFLTVDELVNVITFGLRFASPSIARNRDRDDCGITVS